MTEMEEKAHRYERIEAARALKAHLATIGDKLRSMATVRQSLDSALQDCENHSFDLHDGKVKITKPDPRYGGSRVNVEVSLSAYDPSELAQLLAELEDTKRRLNEARKFCVEIGHPVD